MGLLDNLMGNASEVDIGKLHEEAAEVLAPNEKLERAFKIFRDLYLFTDKRLLLVDKQGLTGSKVEYMSLPYRSITRFCVETAGTFDTDSELKIWVSGSPEPLLKQFKKGSGILELQKVLATYVLK
ncbi:PH domain-containing protein [Archangium lansingense]|uniref:PH domain-containing protein n=1 Tax=Archangium lansingense TaxID=2995310 RepID=A0ABT4A9A5_9BACT|nr:PH domain-containing protein [Archangium lansinium]MCY1078237.1 PH domain-containing protein [Archangium lansinium]